MVGPMIRADGVSVTRRSRGGAPVAAVVEASLGVGPGELLLVLGRPGSGKTTLLECLAGLLPVSRGRVEVGGASGVWSWGAGGVPQKAARKAVGLLFQYPERQVVGRTPLEDVSWGQAGKGAGRAREALRWVGLPETAWETQVEELSRGEKRRVALAGVLARGPEVLLLDEPSVGLDPQGQELVREEVRSFRELGGATIVATHWPEPVLPLATRVLCLDGGRTRFYGAPEELIGASEGDPGLRELLPFSWRLAGALGRDGPLPPGVGEWGKAARRWLWTEGPVAAAGQAAATTPCRASQMPEISPRRPSSRS